MDRAQLQAGTGGRLELSGVLDFASVPAVWRELQQQIDTQDQLEMSLSGVTSANSAALALLLEARHRAGQRGTVIHFTGVPRGLADLAALCNALELLG